MSSSLSALTAGHQKLSGEWKKKDLKGCQESLDKLKLLLTEVAFLPTDGDLKDHQKELLLARDVLEIGANHAISAKDTEAFERYMSQLKTYYVDYAGALPESAYMYELLGLNLLCLLSKNKIADFHTELEHLSIEALQNNPYVRCPVRLEQFIMEGSYNKVR